MLYPIYGDTVHQFSEAARLTAVYKSAEISALWTQIQQLTTIRAKAKTDDPDMPNRPLPIHQLRQCDEMLMHMITVRVKLLEQLLIAVSTLDSPLDMEYLASIADVIPSQRA